MFFEMLSIKLAGIIKYLQVYEKPNTIVLNNSSKQKTKKEFFWKGRWGLDQIWYNGRSTGFVLEGHLLFSQLPLFALF